MAGGCFFVVKAAIKLLNGQMSDIATSDKITNLWPAPPSRPIDKSGSRENSSQNQQDKKKHKDTNEVKEDGPGKNIDEYA